MHFVTSFIGEPPSYWVYNIQQIRLFSDNPIWCITDHPAHQIMNEIKKYKSVNIINYIDVINQDFNPCLLLNKHKFRTIPNLKGRHNLFFRAVERFSLCDKLIKQQNLQDVLFLEIDNMIYMDPTPMIQQLSTKQLAYTYSNIGRCISGIMYIRDKDSMDTLIDSIKIYLNTTHISTANEMTILWEYMMTCRNDVQLLPSCILLDKIKHYAYENSNVFPCIFDASGIGIYLFGLDPFHTNNKIIKNVRCPWSEIDYTKYTYEWIYDSRGRKCPWIIFSKNIKYPIFNLHVHAKNLHEALSV